MRNSAARLVGEHDFRNLCKLDLAKQLATFWEATSGPLLVITNNKNKNTTTLLLVLWPEHLGDVFK